MKLSSNEIVRRAIEMEYPPRLPLKLEKPVETERWGRLESDVAVVRWKYIGTGDRQKRQTYDEWGCLWIRSEMNNMGQIKSHPLPDWDLLDTYRWPDPEDPALYEGMEDQFGGLEDKYILTDFFMLIFERMQALRGFENCLMDFYQEPEKTAALADRLVDFDLGVIGNIARRFPGRIHGFWFTEDWGTQQSLMIHPRLWRSFFKPRYRVLFDALHAAGWHIWMHTDGRMNAILEDLVELGLDVVNFQQPRVNGIEEIGRQFRGRLCFESSADIQATLPAKSPEEIKEEARLLLEQWASPRGGFILSIDENEVDLNIPHENTLAMIDGFLSGAP
jgi:hypothetical protein